MGTFSRLSGHPVCASFIEKLMNTLSFVNDVESAQVEDAARLVGAQSMPGSCHFVPRIREPQN